MDKLDFFIEWYHKENERNVGLSDSLNIPVGIITAIAAAQFYLFSEYKFMYPFDFLAILFLSMTVINFVLWIATSFYLFISYYGLFSSYTYEYLPYPELLDAQWKELESYCTEYKDVLEHGTTADSLADSQMKDLLIKCLSINIGNNDRKSAAIHQAKRTLFISFITLIIGFIPFVINYQSNKLIFKKQPMSTQAPKPQAPPPPKSPPTRQVKEGGTPPPPPSPKREHK